MSMAPFALIKVQAQPFELSEEVQRLTAPLQKAGENDIGAIVTFTGLCRGDAGRLEALELEHYPGMAEDEIGRVTEQALQRWPLQGISVIHRFGKIAVGEPIVLVITLSAHRQAAFEAANYLMDYLKTRAPFWKKEHSTTDAPGAWVEAKAQDDVALARWLPP
jgi:molybdopterin synthase catalytic subunit